jgi:hypothetical protein
MIAAALALTIQTMAWAQGKSAGSPFGSILDRVDDLEAEVDGLQATAGTDVNCVGCVDTDDIADDAVTSSKIAPGAVDTEAVGGVDGVRNLLDSALLVRNITIPGEALNMAGEAERGPYQWGLRLKGLPFRFSVAQLALRREPAWDGGDMTLSMLIRRTADKTGFVRFEVNARGVGFEDEDVNGPGITPAAICSGGVQFEEASPLALKTEICTLTAEQMAGDAWWEIFIRRDFSGDDAYTDGIDIVSVAITYGARF